MPGRRLFRLLPASLSDAIRRARKAYRLHRAIDLQQRRARKRFNGTHVAVAGLFSTTTGLGRAAELVSLTLLQQGYTIARVDLAQALGMPTTTARRDCISAADCQKLAISDVVIVVNPEHLAIAAFDSEWLVERCVVGHWIWELEVLPSFWRTATKSYDEIWTPTELVRDVVGAHLGSDIPVKVMPYAVGLDPMTPRDAVRRDAVRARLGVGADDFVAGYSFAADSNYYRKNPEDAVAVFRRAFAADTHPVRLLLRCHDFVHRPAERSRLAAMIADDPRIRIFDSADRIDIVDFYAAIDVYLATSRAEGYGLNLVEASQAGVPVIATGWRIAREIADLPGIHLTSFQLINVDDPQGHYTGLPRAKWAAPNIDEMADRLRDARTAFCATVVDA